MVADPATGCRREAQGDGGCEVALPPRATGGRFVEGAVVGIGVHRLEVEHDGGGSHGPGIERGDAGADGDSEVEARRLDDDVLGADQQRASGAIDDEEVPADGGRIAVPDSSYWA